MPGVGLTDIPTGAVARRIVWCADPLGWFNVRQCIRLIWWFEADRRKGLSALDHSRKASELFEQIASSLRVRLETHSMIAYTLRGKG